MNRIRKKVMTIARFNLMLKHHKDNNEQLMQYKKFSSDGKLPKGLLMKSMSEIKNEVNQFLAVKNIDIANEKFPI